MTTFKETCIYYGYLKVKKAYERNN